MVRSTEEAAGDLPAARSPTKKSFNDLAHELTTALFTPLARGLQRMNISANFITVLGFVLNLSGGAVLLGGRRWLAAALIAVGGILDGLDGLLARVSGQASRYGAFLDSVLDRWSEAVVFLGLLIWYLQNGMTTEVVLVYISLASSLLVSYTRARAEGVGAQCKEGLFTRLERVVILVAGLVLNQLTLTLWVLAVFATLTAVQRIYVTWKYLKTHPEG